MIQTDLIINIILIPKVFYESKNVSFHTLLKKYNVPNYLDKINTDMIYDAVIEFPECVNWWLRWSEDKRVPEGWYISITSNNNYEVGYFSDLTRSQMMKFSDLNKAVSSYIHNEIKDSCSWL